jgi:predicted GTPase
VYKSGEIIKEKEIIMLLGTTGSGKSTTVHYLAGSKMRMVKVNTITHIEPYKIYNEDLKKVITSWKAKSETRYVTPVNFNHNNKNLIITDTPGSEDT